MRSLMATLAACSMAASADAQEARKIPAVAPPEIRAVAPALADYTDIVLFDDLWKRSDLTPRDRSLVTIAALITGGHTRQMPGHFNRALANGVTQTDIIGAITHLAFYAGWPNAMSAVPVAEEVFEARRHASQGIAPAEAGRGLAILRRGSEPPTVGSAETFTGQVTVDQRFQRESPARIGGGVVTFEAGARTAWHTHPLGQTLVVTAGSGLVQREGEAPQTISQGDIVWIPPGVRHWHGASPASAMTHVAIAEAQDGKAVDWMEQVGDADYAATPAASVID